jgi:Mg2+ and Co2+ transporter CorA
MSMRTLSVVSTVFLRFLDTPPNQVNQPTTTGTNFVNVPELTWHFGYLYFWCLCTGCAAAFMVILWRTGMLSQ